LDPTRERWHITLSQEVGVSNPCLGNKKMKDKNLKVSWTSDGEVVGICNGMIHFHHIVTYIPYWIKTVQDQFRRHDRYYNEAEIEEAKKILLGQGERDGYETAIRVLREDGSEFWGSSRRFSVENTYL
jgi:hypothetical protein